MNHDHASARFYRLRGYFPESVPNRFACSRRFISVRVVSCTTPGRMLYSSGRRRPEMHNLLQAFWIFPAVHECVWAPVANVCLHIFVLETKARAQRRIKIFGINPLNQFVDQHHFLKFVEVGHFAAREVAEPDGILHFRARFRPHIFIQRPGAYRQPQIAIARAMCDPSASGSRMKALFMRLVAAHQFLPDESPPSAGDSDGSSLLVR